LEDNVQTITATEFKATCLDLLDRVQSGEIEELAITKRGQVVAVVRRPKVTQEQAEALFGCMKGTFGIPPDLDLTAPVFEGEIEAESGRLYSE
jgi:prevent-host-death family protein